MKALGVLLLCTLSVLYVSAISESAINQSFTLFKAQYNKTYSSPLEEKLRYSIFSANVRHAEYLNANSKGSAVYGVTKFSDLSPVEFRQIYLTYQKKSTEITPQSHYKPLKESVTAIPATFDWRNQKAVTPVKNQGQCGSCWAFSATEAIESAWFLAKNPLISLAPQQIVDCDTVDQGCNGGDTPTAYEYVIKAGGMETESEYPYVGEDQNCAFKSSAVKAKINGWHYITQNHNETEMQVRLVAEGPLSVCVDAVTWQFYIGGVIAYGDLCYNSLDHCVMVTGYGQENGYQVWNVRNSWGSDWGENGYLWVERGYDLCGISDEVTIPTV